MIGRQLSQLVACLLLFFCDFSSTNNFQTSANHSAYCFWINPITDGQTQYMFLYQFADNNERSFQLVDSIWSTTNNLLDCIVSTDQAVIEGFSSKCYKARETRPFLETPDERFDISTLVEPTGPCVAVGHSAGLGVPRRRARDLRHRYTGNTMSLVGPIGSKKLRRSKRAWMIPGTMWCGAGNKASAFSDLGVFEETDKCCREHDHCKETIASFEFSYGVLNTNLFALSHCDCDNKFRRCLHNANDSMSYVVGYGYFNVLRMRCFEFSQRIECGQRNWWGMCQFNQLYTYALVKEPTDYNSTFPKQEEDKLDVTIHAKISVSDSKVTTGLAMSDITQTSHSSQSLSDITQTTHSSQSLSDITQTTHSSQSLSDITQNTDSSQSTDATQTQTKDSTTKTVKSTHTQANILQNNTTIQSQTQRTQSAQAQTTTGVIYTNITTASPKTSIHPEIHIKQKVKLSVCVYYKDLDSCHHKIPALQEKFGLHNPEHTTLFHCNCTARLARELMDQNRVDGVHSLLLDFVSKSCFILPQNCTESKRNCFSSVPERPLVHRWIKDALLWRHLAAPKRKSKRTNTKRAKRTNHSFRLYKKCLRVHSKLYKTGFLRKKII